MKGNVPYRGVIKKSLKNHQGISFCFFFSMVSSILIFVSYNEPKKFIGAPLDQRNLLVAPGV